MISQFLNADTIEVDVRAEDWQDALRKAGKLLVQEGRVEAAYVENTIQAVKELGPYIVIMPGVALGHSRPDATVKETCIQMIRLKEPVAFGSECNDPVRLVFMFATTDAEAHLEILQDLAAMLMDQDALDILLQSNHTQEIKELLKKY